MWFLSNIVRVFVLFLLFPFVSSSFVLPGDNDYMIFEADKYRIIFDKQYLSSINTINEKIKNQIEAMSKFKNKNLEEPLTIILFSSRNQISNAFATVLPSFTIGMYPTGVLGLNELTLPFWFDGVFEHELNHVFQMSHSKYPALTKFFNLPSILFFYFYIPYPNMFLPTFILEGDSVLKESLFNYGGRLYNGYARAFVYSQIKHYRHQIDRFTKKNLLTFQRTPHAGREKYLHGGYFMAMLAETYSHETVNAFFKVDKEIPSRKIRKQIKETSVKEKLSPLFAENFSFRGIYLFLEDLAKSYFNYWLKEAQFQVSSSEPVLLKSHICPPFGGADDEVFFLNSDFKSVPVLRIFNKKTKKWTKKKSDLPLGKVFKVNNVYYARSSQEIKPYVIHYSLFSEGLHNNKQFESKYVQDLQDNKILYIDPKNNLDGFKLYLNDSLYSHVHSNALFDNNGNIYFFKQNNKIRTLYKNKRPLFSYPGYYGSLLDVDKDGTIYFTGSSPYGSSVYQYKDRQVFRSVSSDTVVQARKISNKEFIVCEVTPYGYEYKIIPVELRTERPVLYKYKFEKRKPLRADKKLVLADLSKAGFSDSLSKASKLEASKIGTDRQVSSVTKDKKKQNTVANPLLEYKDYSALRNIHYKGVGIQGIATGVTNILGAIFLFSDYLQHNVISLVYSNIFPYYYFEKGLQVGGLNYQNRVYPLEWNMGYEVVYDRFNVETNIPDESDVSLEHKGYLHFNYPLFKKGRWFSSISSLKLFEFLNDSATKGLWRGQINWGYSQFFPYSYASNKAFVLSIFFDNQYYFDEKLNGFKSGAIWDSAFYLGGEFYMFPSLSYARSFHPEVNPVQVSLYRSASFKDSDYSSSSFSHSSDPYISRFEDAGSGGFAIGDIYAPLFKNRYKAEGIGMAALGFKKVFSISSGGLDRFVPLVRVKWLILENLLDYGSTEVDGVVSSDTGSFDDSTSVREIQERIELAQEKKKREKVKAEKYVQWLEWTAGVESEFIVLSRMRLIIGFSMGLRTPLKFWESSSNKSKDKSEGSSSFGGTLDSISLNSAFTNIYFKMPL